MPAPTTAEVLAEWVKSEHVRLRGVGVVGTWLAGNTNVEDPIKAAEDLIKAMSAGDRVTMIKGDFDAFINDIKAGKGTPS
ncbi:uncharacterized protein RMCC_5910 [Mycolicibacterium canariasense]|uniref:Uncharacterized protein n=1 Tax=Mycolicibacterium canariasense TaxID=228230 RepID=A0A124E359_MYCCR|nr:hypothetical protein [Mycolicibacterium canariasense]GAS98945.1 uncharacterized protein RMCC_5910 [Mycolicibacterium canariasense]